MVRGLSGGGWWNGEVKAALLVVVKWLKELLLLVRAETLGGVG